MNTAISILRNDGTINGFIEFYDTMFKSDDNFDNGNCLIAAASVYSKEDVEYFYNQRLSNDLNIRVPFYYIKNEHLELFIDKKIIFILNHELYETYEELLNKLSDEYIEKVIDYQYFNFSLLFQYLGDKKKWDLFEKLISHPKRNSDTFLTYIVINGNSKLYFECVNSFNTCQELLIDAFYGGSQIIIDDLVEKGYVIDEDCFISASESDNVNLVKHCLSIGIGNISIGIDRVIKSNLCTNVFNCFLDYELEPNKYFDKASSSNKIKIMKRTENPITLLVDFMENLIPVERRGKDCQTFSHCRVLFILQNLYGKVQIDVDKIPKWAKYDFREQLSKIVHYQTIERKYARKWFYIWYQKSADPNGNGAVWKNWQKKMIDMYSEYNIQN